MIIPVSRMKLAIRKADKAIEDDDENVNDDQALKAYDVLEALAKDEVAMKYLCAALTELAKP